MTAAHKAAPVGEPVVIGHAAAWLVAMAGQFLIGHTHLVTAGQWGPLSSTLVPAVTTVLVALSAFLIRRVVSPARAFEVRVEAATAARLGRPSADALAAVVDDAATAALTAAEAVFSMTGRKTPTNVPTAVVAVSRGTVDPYTRR